MDRLGGFRGVRGFSAFGQVGLFLKWIRKEKKKDKLFFGTQFQRYLRIQWWGGGGTVFVN